MFEYWTYSMINTLMNDVDIKHNKVWFYMNEVRFTCNELFTTIVIGTSFS
jgi:hypothetical protein